MPHPPPPSLGTALAYWLKLGLISFGGPAGQIALMHRELVERRRWISEGRYLHALNYCMLLPGPEAIQLAIYISWLLHGMRGGIAAGILFFLPAFALLSLLAGIYLAYGQLPVLLGLFYGIKPAVVAIVLFAAWRIGRRILRNSLSIGITVGAFLAIFAFDVAFPWIVLAAATTGAIAGHWRPEWFRGTAASPTGGPHGPALIDDDTPPPPHARFSRSKLMLTVFGFVALWGMTRTLLGNSPELTNMADFFTRAAFLTFGGAYAVLPYVYQGAVEHYGWLSGAQMMDGLALGETTPGPLIIVVAWVGYLGGNAKAVLADPIAAGLAGATVATWFTFLPSFLLVLAGAPVIEATRDRIRFTAPLTAISAAVVGVIVNLALFFAWHCFWPHATAAMPFAGGFDATAALLALAAFLALWKFQIDTLRVIGGCAALGVTITQLV